jgi:transposase-like protein
MTVGEIHPHGDFAYPNWVPSDVRHYLIHIEDGVPIRALARSVGCHASTILRQVRRNENRRDDPLMDTAFERLATSARVKTQEMCKDTKTMTAIRKVEALPDRKNIEAEARRILRRLCEPDAVLAIAPQMDKAVVVRELPDGRTIRTAVLDRSVAEAFLMSEWIELGGKGKVARYSISAMGRKTLKRLLSEQGEGRQGFEEAPTPFADQHRCFAEREVEQGEARVGKRIRYNTLESPLQAISRRKGKDGRPFLNSDLIAAGERLREDFELAQLGPKVAQNWDRFLTGGDRGGFSGSGPATGPEGARTRVAKALEELGPGLGDVALRVCCFLEGMEQAEKRMGWAARSGKIVLKIALQRLARHYSELGEKSAMIG